MLSLRLGPRDTTIKSSPVRSGASSLSKNSDSQGPHTTGSTFFLDLKPV